MQKPTLFILCKSDYYRLSSGSIKFTLAGECTCHEVLGQVDSRHHCWLSPYSLYVKQETSRKSPETTCNLPVSRSNTILFMTSDLNILTFDLDADILSAYLPNFLE